MHNHFKALSISHKTAPVEVRECMALNGEETRLLLNRVSELFDLQDVLVLSTCNRSEIYYSSSQDLGMELVKVLALHKGLEVSEDVYQHFTHITDHNQAVQHLLRVATGLESQIVGDMQITNQVKSAYQLSADANVAGPFLHRLLHTAFFTNKRVVQETAFRDGAASVSYATLELISELTIAMESPSILVVGLGDIGSDLCLNLADHKSFKDSRILVSNRSIEKAHAVASASNFEVIPFESFEQHLKQVDVVVSAVSMNELLISQQLVQSVATKDFKYFIDLGVPRSIEASIEEVNGMLLYNIDDIQSRADEALQRRLSAIPKVENLVSQAIDDFDDWSKDMSVSPTINKLKNALEQIRKDEIARYLKDLPSDEAMVVEKLTKSIMQKVIKLPVLQLKAACRRGEQETLIDVLNDLFDLEKESLSTKK